MKQPRYTAFAIAVSALLLAPAFPPVAFAQDSAAEQQQVTVTGQLTQSATGDYVLLEWESDREIVLTGSTALADHVGTDVTVTGYWSSDGQQLTVVSVEAA